MLLQVKELSKQYLHPDGPVNALKDIEIKIEEGAFVTITGPSGSGKSTLLYALGACRRKTHRALILVLGYDPFHENFQALQS